MDEHDRSYIPAINFSVTLITVFESQFIVWEFDAWKVLAISQIEMWEHHICAGTAGLKFNNSTSEHRWLPYFGRTAFDDIGEQNVKYFHCNDYGSERHEPELIRVALVDSDCTTKGAVLDYICRMMECVQIILNVKMWEYRAEYAILESEREPFAYFWSCRSYVILDNINIDNFKINIKMVTFLSNEVRFLAQQLSQICS